MVEKREEILKRLGNTLKSLRLKHKYSREQMSERAGISTRYLTAIENEQKRPKFEILYSLIRALGESADKIFYPELETDDDAENIKRLYLQCSERDRKLVRNLLDSILDNK